MATARASAGLAYPDRFYAASTYAGFGGSPRSSSPAASRFQNDVALLLYGLYQQATVGPCTVPKPRAWNPVEQSKWTSWYGLGNMASTEAMRLFVKVLEEEDPAWYSRVPELAGEPVVDVEMLKPKEELHTLSPYQNGNSLPKTKTVSTESGIVTETNDKDVISEGLGLVGMYDQWIAPSVSGKIPKPRYTHGAAVLHEKMYIFGGNHNGRYLNDLQVLDLKTLKWSRIEAKALDGPLDSSTATYVVPSAGHSLIPWGDKLLCIGGHTKDPSETIAVREFNPQTCLWTNLKTNGKPPISRGGQSATLVGNTVVIFGGEDAKRSLLNDLHVLVLETMTWEDVNYAVGTPPSPRSVHAAACHADRYLLIFGGGSYTTCFNDLHVLDLQTMEWSRPDQQGVTPGPRAGHAGVTVGENWFITGGGNNVNGISETLVLSMATLVWSVVTTVEGRVPLASEGLSLVTTTYKGEDFLLSFGGYNGHYNNEVFVLKPSHLSDLQSRIIDGSASHSVAVVVPTTKTSRDMELEIEATQDKKIKEIEVDNGDSELNVRHEGAVENLVDALRTEKEELEATLQKEQLQNLQELQSVRSQLAAEQSRCFKLEVDVAELRQKLETLGSVEKEVELLRRQKAAAEQEALNAKQRQVSGGVWGWLAGTPPSPS
ncbi:hypothetical protein ZIOFF_044971 [Zingiber officinale]|uniref:ACB domain-containing protein n=1 Tax=Zingiber officinale TaxID=94328 RepID=A0A8J5G328_ZINOF|nr:hypothetical protein ZIOFF_044971 [Zingiber officinale]